MTELYAPNYWFVQPIPPPLFSWAPAPPPVPLQKLYVHNSLLLEILVCFCYHRALYSLIITFFVLQITNHRHTNLNRNFSSQVSLVRIHKFHRLVFKLNFTKDGPLKKNWKNSYKMCGRPVQWHNGRCTRPWIERSGFRFWPGSLCYSDRASLHPGL